MTQIVLTFVFVAVILTIKDIHGRGCQPGKNGVLQALAVVITLYGCIQAALARTGAGFNPAVCAAQIALSLMELDNTNGYLTHYAYAYLAGPWIGGALAGIFHNIYIKMFKENCVDEESPHSQRKSVN